MIQRINVFVLLVACIIVINPADSAPADDDNQESSPPSTTRNIFKPPNESDVSEIEDSSTPWVQPEFIPPIKEFKENLFEDLQTSPQVQKIYDMQIDSETTRDIFFRLPNKFLTDIGHPVPAAFSNIMSKSASLFEPLTMPIFFETVAVSLAEFLLSHTIEIERSTSQKYVDLLSDALDEADLNDVDSIFQATLDTYGDFVKSYGFKLIDIIDELFELFTSELIVLLDK